MSNFKSGSGNLDFGSDDTETENQTDAETKSSSKEADSSPTDSGTESTSGEPESEQKSAEASTETESTGQEYPYFVRRNNVGGERETRLELHVRDEVAERETEFRSELAEQLDANEISKTDAREFALLAAFEHPENVAELMREDGFGALD